VDYAGLKVDVGPPKAAQFAKPHSGEDRGDDNRAAPCRRILNEGMQFCHRREIEAGPQGAA
jgi:hypothetical protein